MGATRVTTRITSMERTGESYEEIFLVETGATDSMVPANRLDQIGVRHDCLVVLDVVRRRLKAFRRA